MAVLRGGSTVAGFPVLGKSASENNIPKVKGNLMVNSLLSDDGIKVTSTGDIYVKVAGVDKKVFHEGNLIASGSSSQDFTTRDLTIHGVITQMSTNTLPNYLRRNSSASALYIDQSGTGDIAQFTVGAVMKTRVAANGDIYVGTSKVFHEGNLVASGSATTDFTAKDILISGLIQMDGITIIDASKNLTNIGTINSAAITSTGFVQGASLMIGATTIVDASRNMSSIGTISSGAITSSSAIQGATFNLGATNIIDAARNIVNITSLTSTGAIQGASFKIGTTTIVDASRNLLSIGTIGSGSITSTGTVTSVNTTVTGKTTASGTLVIPVGIDKYAIA